MRNLAGRFLLDRGVTLKLIYSKKTWDTFHLPFWEHNIPHPAGTFESMIFLTSRLVGYVEKRSLECDGFKIGISPKITAFDLCPVGFFTVKTRLVNPYSLPMFALLDLFGVPVFVSKLGDMLLKPEKTALIFVGRLFTSSNGCDKIGYPIGSMGRLYIPTWMADIYIW